MFEQVGQTKRNRRRAWGPLLLTVVLNVAGFTTLVVNSGSQIVSHFQNPMPPPPIFTLDFPKPAPPGPPAAAAAAAKPKPTPKPEVEPDPVEPDPVEPVEPTEPVEPVELVEPVEPTETPDAGGGGIGGGDGEVGGGGGDCPPGQVCDGDSTIACPPGMLCDGDSLFVSSADVRVKRRVSPRYPDAAKSLNLPETRCIVTFSIDQKGRPEQVSIDGCPSVFHPALREAAFKWRFYPVKDGNGQPQAATFRLSTIFRLR